MGVTTTSVENSTNQYHHGSPSETRKLHDPKIHHECAYSGSHKAHRPRGNSLAKTEPGLLPCSEWQACSSQVRDRAGASRRYGHAPEFRTGSPGAWSPTTFLRVGGSSSLNATAGEALNLPAENRHLVHRKLVEKRVHRPGIRNDVPSARSASRNCWSAFTALACPTTGFAGQPFSLRTQTRPSVPRFAALLRRSSRSGDLGSAISCAAKCSRHATSGFPSLGSSSSSTRASTSRKRGRLRSGCTGAGNRRRSLWVDGWRFANIMMRRCVNR